MINMINMINGYMVVNGPDEKGYRGLDRDPWNTIDVGYYDGNLPADIRRRYEAMKADANRGFWWPIATSRTDAMVLLAFTQSRDQNTELIGVGCSYLDQVGTARAELAYGILLGFDVVSVGEWSLLRGLSDAGVALPDRLAAGMNEWKLLRHVGDAAQVESVYRGLAGGNRVEPIAGSEGGLPVEAVAVYLEDGTTIPLSDGKGPSRRKDGSRP